MTDGYDVVIVGGGHGGAQAAGALRQAGFEGSVAVIGEEKDPPYERPALSKAYLSGERPFERMLLRPAGFWAEKAVDLLLGRRVLRVDPGARTVTTSDGGSIAYGALIWSAGGSPRTLTCSGHDLVGVHTVRSRADVDVLIDELPTVRDVVVVGGGYIGLEAAAVLTKLGRRVVLLEAQSRLLARVAGTTLSDFYENEHRGHGVEIHFGVEVECLEGDRGRIERVRTADGRTFTCDAVIVGIGIVPAVEPLLVAGAEGGNGVAVDDRCRTSLPNVYAIGDCALHPNVFAGGASVRVESVQNATDQAIVAARSIVGVDARYEALPWFWSDQYDVKLQTVGLAAGFDQEVLRGDLESGRFSVVYLKEGRVVALDCVNSARDYAQGRRLVAERSAVEPERLADASSPLKELFVA